ncbi:hypothetical protein DFP98_102291 [Cohnella phaseoli]|uniref:Uncharacterized protein n=1 Tax=Cohnella phaseoli TaxID=456490 RepID=A0A3D9KMQ4_9BACL|nr:hypothetical protein DFP98_102291 [Cohnella phaseoli]
MMEFEEKVAVFKRDSSDTLSGNLYFRKIRNEVQTEL